MMKPGIDSYNRFKELFGEAAEKAGKEIYLIPYFIAAHPGTKDDDMVNLRLWLKRNGFRADQVQTFMPTPMSLASAMYYSERNPLEPLKREGAEVVKTAKGLNQRRLHKAFLRYHESANWPIIRDALKRMDRANLIGSGKSCLVPYGQGEGSKKNQGKGPRSRQRGRPFVTKHTGNAQFKGKGRSQ
jgi:radical SAM superfamily enzyme YgiQ (UPF0313 family)